MPYLIGQCCVDQIIAPPSSGTSNSGLNEVIEFSNSATLVVAWNATRKARFGDAAVFRVEILGPDNKYRKTQVEEVPDSISNTTQYTFDFGGVSSGRIIIS